MERKEAIDTIYNGIKEDDAIISSTGLISREVYKSHDSRQNFYMVGSMGLTSSLGLGIAVNIKDKNVVVIEGDASLLMNLGSLATVGHCSPENFVHIVLDNQSYASCSEEPSVSRTVDLAAIASASGYKQVFTVSNNRELTEALKLKSSRKGPIFIQAKISLGGERNLPRPLDLPSIAERFKLFLDNNKSNIRDRIGMENQIIVLEESQERKMLIENFKQILKKISLMDIEKFRGIGIVLYDSKALHESVHTNTRFENPPLEKLYIYDKACINVLLDLTRWDNPYHDGFILINENGQITDVAQYFVPPIVPGIRPNEAAGIRYHSALYGSLVTGVIATGIVSSKREPYFFQDGKQYPLKQNYEETRIRESNK